MSHPIRFQDHTAFHVQVLRLTLAGGAVSLLLHLVGLVAPLDSRPASLIVYAATAAILGLVALPPARSGLWTSVALAAGLGLLAALGQEAMARASYPWFGWGLYGVAVGIIAGRDLRDHRRYLLPLATAMSMALATYVTQIFRAELRFADYVPPFVAEPGYGLVFGFLVSIGLIARQIVIERDPVMDTYDKVRPTLDGEMRPLSERAIQLYARIREVLRDRRDKGADNQALAKVVTNLVLKVLHLGPKWNEVERAVGQTSAGELTSRIEELEAKAAATTDEVARRQYAMAREALGSQLRYLQDISRSRERVVARVHNYLATLERLHLAVVNHRGADAAKFSEEVQPILDEMDSVGHEIDFASEAMREVAEVEVAGEKAEAPQPTAEPAATEPAAAEPPAPAAVDPELAEAAKQPPAPGDDPEASLTASAFEK